MTAQPPEPFQPGVPSGDPYGTQPGAPYGSPSTPAYGEPPAAAHNSQTGTPYGMPPAGPYGSPYGSQIPRGEQPGVLADRLVARIIDGLIIGIIGYIIIGGIVQWLVTISIVGSAYTLSSLNAVIWLSAAISAILQTALYLGYAGFMESSRGQTVGKMVMKLRVIGPNGGNPTIIEAIKRNIWYAASLLLIVPVIGWLLASAASIAAIVTIAVGINNNTATRQAWHDMFAGGTRVVKQG